jgi:hypothetical protein
MNDPTKASTSLMFIALMSQFVPLVDSSNSASQIMETEAQSICRMNTAGFEDWILMYLGRILSLCENLPDQHGNGSGNAESSLMEMVMV